MSSRIMFMLILVGLVITDCLVSCVLCFDYFVCVFPKVSDGTYDSYVVLLKISELVSLQIYGLVR